MKAIHSFARARGAGGRCNARGVQAGQALVFGLVLLVIGVVALLFSFSAAQAGATRLRLGNAADAAAYSAALWRARVLNYHAYANRAIVAQEVAIAQAVTLTAWSRYFESFVENAGTVLSVAFPPSAPAFSFAKSVVTAAREATEQAAALEIWLRGAQDIGYKEILATSQEILNLSVSTFALGAVANEVARANDPSFFAFALPEQGSFDQFTRRHVADRDRLRLQQLVVDSLDPFVAGPRGLDLVLPLPSQCFGQSLDLEKWFHVLQKRGGTVMSPELERWEAADTMSLHDWRRRGFFILGSCEKREALAWGWGAAETSDDGRIGQLLANPGNVSANPAAAWMAQNGMADLPDGFDSYAGITRVRELNYEALANQRFPEASVAVLARVDHDDVRTAHTLNIGTGRLRLPDNFAGRRMWAVAAAQVYFRKPGQSGERVEYASLFNPYWQVRLAEPTEAQRAAALSYVH